MKIDHELHLHVHYDPPPPDARIDELLRLVNLLIVKETEVMADLTALTAQVKSNTDAEAAAVLLLNQLAALIVQNANDPAALAQLASDLKASADPLAAAILANTPSAIP
jgi:hypothetical protein